MNQNNIHEGRAAAGGKGEAAWETSENLGSQGSHRKHVHN